MMMDWTDDEIMDVIDSLTAKSDYPPTVREIATAVEVSPSTMHLRLKRMVARNRISYSPGHARTIKVIHQTA